MIVDPLSDGHVHTSMCHHATGDMEEYVTAALRQGLKEIIFLEHMEEGIESHRTTWLTEKDFDNYFKEGRRLKKKYQGRLTIGLGVEVGYNPELKEILLKRLATREWDRIGISYHFHRKCSLEKHLNLVSKTDIRIQQLDSIQKKKIESEYYKNLIDAITYLPGNVLCHLDAVLRYHPQQSKTDQPWSLIEKLLDAIVEKKMAIEINTSGITIRGEVFPNRKILALALEKNIPLVAGSDAHKPEDVGRHFSLLKDMAI